MPKLAWQAAQPGCHPRRTLLGKTPTIGRQVGRPMGRPISRPSLSPRRHRGHLDLGRGEQYRVHFRLRLFRPYIVPSCFPGGELIISGAGVINNSSVCAKLLTVTQGKIIFNNASTAASAQMVTILTGRASVATARQSSTIHRVRLALRSLTWLQLST